MDSNSPIVNFWWLVRYCAHENPEQRPGQVTFNVLADNRPDLSEQIRGGPLDAFNERPPANKRLDAMCKWIEDNW